MQGSNVAYQKAKFKYSGETKEMTMETKGKPLSILIMNLYSYQFLAT